MKDLPPVITMGDIKTAARESGKKKMARHVGKIGDHLFQQILYKKGQVLIISDIQIICRFRQ